VEHDVGTGLTGTEWVAVYNDGIDIGVDTGAGYLDDFAVDYDASLGNQHFTIAARGNACAGQDFL
jgi:hypothetical protein